ncbi:hypothetical protein O3M35_013212 [Rhynocoris fuscipes]|uniref:Uncharacterized protein n=1 Tax=Rhynocoris fuscipes TaxID=488301 RepID=A0AAW1CFF9_9HEMI
MKNMEQVLHQRLEQIEMHRNLFMQMAELKQKVRRERMQIEEQWEGLTELERNECEALQNEKQNLLMQIKNEQLAGSKEILHRSTQSIDKNSNKPPPSRVGNYTIMAKRLQGEIKNLEQNVSEMRARLQNEIEHKTNIETKVREMRTNLTLHRRQDPFTAPTTPIQ